MINPLLEVNDLQVEYHNGIQTHVALKNLSFKLKQGEILGIAGESGAGKTTLALTLMGLHSSGTTRQKGAARFYTPFNGAFDLLGLHENEWEKIRGRYISLIPQEIRSAFNPLLTCGQHLSETLLRYGQADRQQAIDKAMEWLGRVGLANAQRIFYSYPHQLSGGQLQRVLIALALCGNPFLLIADEPLASSDFAIHEPLLKLFRHYQQQAGMSMILISHDLNTLEQVTDSILILKDGQQVEFGHTPVLFRQPVHIYTRGLMACRPDIKKKRVWLPELTESGMLEWSEKEQSAVVSQNVKDLPWQPPLLQVVNLTKRFVKKRWTGDGVSQEIRAVEEVSFELYKGETLGLTGPSGCGKTTLVRCITGLLTADTGKVMFKGETIIPASSSDHIRKGRKKIQIIFQNPDSALNPRMTAGHAIMEPMMHFNLHGNRKQQRAFTLHLMDQVGLKAELFNRYPHQLSGGQKQRVVIARALGMQPELLICDEPVSALDVSVQAQILNLLNRLKHNMGLSLIFISHDWPVVYHMSDRILFMADGRIQQAGSAEEIMTWFTRLVSQAAS